MKTPQELKPFAIVSLILGILSIATFWIPLIGILIMIPALAGFIFGIIGFFSNSERSKKIVAALGIFLTLITLVATMPLQNMYFNNAIERVGK